MILRAAWVVPVSSPPVRNGFVEVAGSRLVRVGSWPPPSRARGDVVDLGACALTPGLVNPHTHLELSCYAGRIPAGPFWPWVSQLVRLRRDAGARAREHEAVVAGAWMSLRAGVTCVGDVSRCGDAWRALRHVPIRKVCYAELISIADQPPRNPDELAVALDEVEEDDLLTAGVSPHAPYSVFPEHVRAAVGMAQRRGRPWVMHVAETSEEVAFLRGDAHALPPWIRTRRGDHAAGPETTVAAAVRDLTAEGGAGALVHMNYLTPSDIDAVAAGPHTVIYCPRAHRFFAHPPHPFPRLVRAGAPLAIGTDSLASNESLSLLDELRWIRANVVQMPPADALFAMVTLAAARALGLQRLVGSLEPGKQADLAAFPAAPDVADPVSALLDSAPPASRVWVAGRAIPV